ncbi:MAG: hypothetical protein WCO86_16860, partial [Planctomycetota bacterium]
MNASSKPSAPRTDEPRRPRYVVGIDLGTTNSAMCFVDTDQARWTIETFTIAQVVAAGQVERLEALDREPAETGEAEDRLGEEAGDLVAFAGEL